MELAQDDSKASLIRTLQSGAGLVYIVAHGTEDGGIECSDGLLFMDRFEELLARAVCWFSPVASRRMLGVLMTKGTFPLIDVIDEKTVGAILTHKESHHFPWTYDDSDTLAWKPTELLGCFTWRRRRGFVVLSTKSGRKSSETGRSWRRTFSTMKWPSGDG